MDDSINPKTTTEEEANIGNTSSTEGEPRDNAEGKAEDDARGTVEGEAEGEAEGEVEGEVEGKVKGDLKGDARGNADDDAEEARIPNDGVDKDIDLLDEDSNDDDLGLDLDNIYSKLTNLIACEYLNIGL